MKVYVLVTMIGAATGGLSHLMMFVMTGQKASMAGFIISLFYVIWGAFLLLR